jgi:hypothetical protein
MCPSCVAAHKVQVHHAPRLTHGQEPLVSRLADCYSWSTLFPDLAPGIDEIYEESQQVFLAPGHPQDGQVVFYKVSRKPPSSCSLTTPLIH